MQTFEWIYLQYTSIANDKWELQKSSLIIHDLYPVTLNKALKCMNPHSQHQFGTMNHYWFAFAQAQSIDHWDHRSYQNTFHCHNTWFHACALTFKMVGKKHLRLFASVLCFASSRFCHYSFKRAQLQYQAFWTKCKVRSILQYSQRLRGY